MAEVESMRALRAMQAMQALRVGPIVTTVVAAFVIGLATGFVIKLVLPRHSR